MSTLAQHVPERITTYSPPGIHSIHTQLPGTTCMLTTFQLLRVCGKVAPFSCFNNNPKKPTIWPKAVLQG